MNSKTKGGRDVRAPRNTVPLFRIQRYGAFGLQYLHV